MSQVLRIVYLLSLSFWVGGVVFFSFLVAPVLFRAFSVERAGETVGVIFPGYHKLGILCGLLALVSLVLVALIERRWPLLRLGLLSIMVIMSLYAGLVTGPRASELREKIHQKEGGAPSMELKNEFHRLHQQAVFLNGAILLLGVTLLVDSGIRMR
jgi:hypothetical protein